jgi:tRNA (guanosine-2'-O-)-methyltransferase
MTEKHELITYLSQCLTPERITIIDEVLQNRTRYITIVLEDIYQPQNASAVLRTCDCMGVQDVHVIENLYKYNINRDVVLGADNWLTLNKYHSKENNSKQAIRQLRDKGYRIVATSPHKNSCTPDQFSPGKGKAAVFFGTEVTGLSETVMKEADEFLTIPMFGFTESFNLSVSAAIVLNQLIMKLRNSDIDWKLTQEEIEDLKIKWYTANINRGDLVVKRFYEEMKKRT